MDFSSANDDFEKQLEQLGEMMSGEVDFSRVKGTDGLFSQISENGTPLGWTPQSSPALTPSMTPPQVSWELNLSDENTFLKKDDSVFYTSAPAATQGLTKSVLPLDEAANNFASAPQTASYIPPALPEYTAPPPKNHLNIATFQQNLNPAYRDTPHIQSIMTQPRVSRMNWTCEQFDAALRLF